MGAKKIIACNEEAEQLMTWLRRFLLEQADSQKKQLAPDQYLELIEAVAQYCFNTDFIFNSTVEEDKYIEELRGKLESDPSVQQDPVKVGIYACYEPLYKLKTAKDIARFTSLSPIKEIVRAQLTDCFDLQKRADRVTSLTEITDAVSLKVREQYEEYPYPRWRELSRRPPAANNAAGRRDLNQAGVQILIAGSGTGLQPLDWAVNCPNASILAVDLSRASLAYAEAKAEELGIKNVEFRHADILKLGSLDRAFDIISRMGVLHHMNDPLEGWKVLAGLLKPKAPCKSAFTSRLRAGPLSPCGISSVKKAIRIRRPACGNSAGIVKIF